MTSCTKCPESLYSCGFQSKSSGAAGGGRTHNLRLRRPTLYPVELRLHMKRRKVAAHRMGCRGKVCASAQVERALRARTRPNARRIAHCNARVALTHFRARAKQRGDAPISCKLHHACPTFIHRVARSIRICARERVGRGAADVRLHRWRTSAGLGGIARHRGTHAVARRTCRESLGRGSFHPLATGRLLRGRAAYFHGDAAQSGGRMGAGVFFQGHGQRNALDTLRGA